MSQDVTEIEQVLYAYCHLLEQGDSESVSRLFAPDAVLIPEYEGDATHAGRAAILAWYTRYGAAVKAVNHLRHRISCPWIRVSGDTARAICYLDADSVIPGIGATQLSQGRYEDQLVRIDGAWLISERRIIVHGSVMIPKS